MAGAYMEPRPQGNANTIASPQAAGMPPDADSGNQGAAGDPVAGGTAIIQNQIPVTSTSPFVMTNGIATAAAANGNAPYQASTLTATAHGPALAQAVTDVMAEDERASRANILASAGISADQAVKAQQLATLSGLPVDVAARNMDQVQQLAQTQQSIGYLVGNTALTWQMADPDFAAVANDDVPPLSQLETGIRLVGNKLEDVVAGVTAAKNNFAKGVDTVLIVAPLRGLGILANNLLNPNHAAEYQRIIAGDKNYAWQEKTVDGHSYIEIRDLTARGRFGPMTQYVRPGDDLYEFITRPELRQAYLQHDLARADPSKNFLYQLGQSADEKMQQAFPTTAAQDAYWLTGTVPRTLGQVTGFAGATLLGPEAGLAAGAGLGTLGGADSGYQDARAHGADPVTANRAATADAALGGITSLIPGGEALAAGAERLALPVAKVIGEKAASFLATGAANSLFGAAQGATQQLGSNLVAQSLYDKARGWDSDLVSQSVQGAITNLILGFLPRHAATPVQGTAPAAVSASPPGAMPASPAKVAAGPEAVTTPAPSPAPRQAEAAVPAPSKDLAVTPADHIAGKSGSGTEATPALPGTPPAALSHQQTISAPGAKASTAAAVAPERPQATSAPQMSSAAGVAPTGEHAVAPAKPGPSDAAPAKSMGDHGTAKVVTPAEMRIGQRAETQQVMPSQKAIEPASAQQSAGIQAEAISAKDAAPSQSDAARPDPAVVLQAAKSAQAVSSILSGAAASKLRLRDSTLFAASLADMAAHHDPAPLQVSGTVIQNYLQHIDPAGPDLLQHLPSVAAQLPNAIASGRPVAIPVPEFVRALAGRPTAPLLALHVKPAADAPSLAELAQQVAPGAGTMQAGNRDASPAASALKTATADTASPTSLVAAPGSADTSPEDAWAAFKGNVKESDLAEMPDPAGDITVGSAGNQPYTEIALPKGILRKLLDGLNPHYVEDGGPGVNTNCEACVIAFYRRLTGQDPYAVERATTGRTNGDAIKRIAGLPYSGLSLDDIEHMLLSNDRSPRIGFILIDQGNDSFHAINYIKLRRSVIYVDAQMSRVVQLKRDLTVRVGYPRP